MRIIAGRYKGHSLRPVPGNVVRSTADRVKESLFSILVEFTEQADVLDLFCGAGTLGLEALSRGARHVTFVDLSRHSVERTRENLTALRAVGEADVITKDALAALRALGKSARRFSLILADPPYGEGWPSRVLRVVGESGCLMESGVLVIEFHKKDPPGDAPPGFALWTERRFGDTMLGIWRWSKTTGLAEPAARD